MRKYTRTILLFIATAQAISCFNVRRSALSIAEIGTLSSYSYGYYSKDIEYKTDILFHARLHGRDTLIQSVIYTYEPVDSCMHTGDKFYIKYDTLKPWSYVLLPFQPVLNEKSEIDTSVAQITKMQNIGGRSIDRNLIKLKFQTKDSAKQISVFVITLGSEFWPADWIHTGSLVLVKYNRANPYKVAFVFPKHKDY